MMWSCSTKAEMPDCDVLSLHMIVDDCSSMRQSENSEKWHGITSIRFSLRQS